ncbi:MAG: hypothetical protein C0430_01855 [Flavobacterium sp.]|nr:hypothetical protein [Flavobacterium sp.]
MLLFLNAKTAVFSKVVLFLKGKQKKCPTNLQDNSFTNQNQIINNQFITLQRLQISLLFPVKILLLLCCN